MSDNKQYVIEIDTTVRNAKSVVLKKDNIIIDEEHGEFDVVGTIQSILNRNNLLLENDINEVIPNTGPGSFTGIKIGITIANALNWQLGNNKEYKPNYGGEPNITVKKD